MQHERQRAHGSPSDPLVELPSHSHLPRLDLGIEWTPGTVEFFTSVRDFLVGPRPRKTVQASDQAILHGQFVEGTLPVRGFLVSCVWHIAAIWILVLPIWNFLPNARATLKPVQIEVSWYAPADVLPPVNLHSPLIKRTPATIKRNNANKPPLANRQHSSRSPQTILSLPVQVTHPRQTLIRPDAPPAPPKIVVPLPDIVQWATNESPALLLNLSPAPSTPHSALRMSREVTAPDITKSASHAAAQLSITPTLASAPHLEIPLNPATASLVERYGRNRSNNAGPAPDIRDGAIKGGRIGRLVALSATPALPAPEVKVPEGNLAARISMSPDSPKRAPSAAESRAGAASTVTGPYPAAVSVDAGPARRTDLGLAPDAISPQEMISQSMRAYQSQDRNGKEEPQNVADVNPNLPPEEILSGRRVYTLDVTMPNLTSATGSWILNFAQLNVGNDSPLKPKAPLAAPVPIEKVDPKYPPDAIKAHVEGEVVLYAIIRKDGSVDSIQMMRGLDPELDRNAIVALARWKFRPAMRGGEPVDIEAVVHVPFNYKNPHE